MNIEILNWWNNNKQLSYKEKVNFLIYLKTKYADYEKVKEINEIPKILESVK